jgi:glycogen operon protein
MKPLHLEFGRQEPMGAHARDGGVNFAVFSEHAEAIDLCVFDEAGSERRLRLFGPDDGIFHGFIAEAQPGLTYGLRAHGPYRPEAGLLFNPAKLLLDPWAREIVGTYRHEPIHHGYVLGHAQGNREIDPRDNAAQMLKARVAPPASQAPGTSNRPRHRDEEVVLYEVHVKGFSMQHPQIPEELRGTYGALAHPVAIAHFRNLGVTTLSLLPVHYHLDEGPLSERGAVNYWGYNTLGFFAPDPRFAREPSRATEEFRAMVQALHAEGIEVLLDVVYNHTPEGNEYGPTLSFRGLDQASWYRLQRDDRSRCENISGCGNTLNVAHPRVTQFVLDSLRYWMHEMGVDGFRFDLAPVLGREGHGFDPHASFFTALRQDPILAGARLVAEPWDGAADGYQVGRFPGRFQEWNDKFRDAVRGYWLRRGVDRGEFARRFTASDDLFRHHQRLPTASVNFIAVHDGFTLADVVSYSRKHNEANGEGNRDGRDDELSGNLGVEGPTDDRVVIALRRRTRKAMMATLLLAQGTPMLCAGDEIGNSQGGNNNAYSQDNATGWLDWPGADHNFAQFVAEASALRRSEPLLHHGRWFTTPGGAGHGPKLSWLMPAGGAPSVQDWHDLGSHALTCLIDSGFDLPAEGSARLLLLFNPEAQEVAFALPDGDWRLALDSSGVLASRQGALPRALAVPAHALVVLRPPDPHRHAHLKK